MQSHIDCISLCCLPYACSYNFSMFQKHYSFWGPSSDDDDYDVNIRAQRQAAPPNAGFRLWSTGKNVRTVSFSLFSLYFPKTKHILRSNAQCLVPSVLKICTRFPYIALNFTPKCWIEAGGQCWTWEQIGGGWLGMPMTKMPKSRDSHNATRRSHNAMWTRDNSRNMMRSKLQASSQAPWEAKREADVSIQFC